MRKRILSDLYLRKHANWLKPKGDREGVCRRPGTGLSVLCQDIRVSRMNLLVLRGDRIVIPQSLRKVVVELSHEGHQGVVKTNSRLRTKVWWPKMDGDVERMCRGCHGCQVTGQYSPPEPMQRTEPPTGLWQDVAADLMGPMPGGENLLVVADYYIRFFEVVVMKSTTTPRIIDALMDIFARFGFS